MAQNVPDEKNMITLKALVDKGRNKVIFVEADNDFIDVLFSFLTIPMGHIVRLARDHSTPLEIGCMNKLYESVEKLDVRVFRSNACRDMLLHPRSSVDLQCKKLKLKIIDDAEPTQYFKCSRYWHSPEEPVSYFTDVPCPKCSSSMKNEVCIYVGGSQAGGVFVKEPSRAIITDDLQVIPPKSAASISLFTELGDTNVNTYEERTFCIGVEEVINLLVRSLVSKTPFTETLLKNYPVQKFSDVNLRHSIDSQMFGASKNEEKENISVQLIVSKSKNVVCYAEVREDFVNLLFSIFTLPLGFILKHILHFSWKGCTGQLWKGVQDFDEDFFKSNQQKELLCSPKLLPGFSYENTLYGIEEAVYLYGQHGNLSKLATDRSIFTDFPMDVKVMDPKSYGDKDYSASGFLKGPAFFTVTDNLDVRPMSPTFQFSVLKDLKVPLNDIEGRTVLIGKKEALSLLVSCFVSHSVLTNAFLRMPTDPTVKQEQ